MEVQSFGTGPPLVMVPGWAMTAAVWDDFARCLASRWRVSLLDLPGHGLNRHIPFEAGTVARDLAAAAPRGAVWLGWSLGAQVALAAALSGAAPAGLVLLSATPRFVTGPDWTGAMAPEALSALRERVRRDPVRGIRRFLGLLGQGGPVDAEAARTLRQRLADAGHDPESLIAGLDWLADTDLRPDLPRLQVPSWWVGGEHDPLVPPAATRAGAELAGGTVVSLPGAGHMPFITHPDALLPVLERARTIGD